MTLIESHPGAPLGSVLSLESYSPSDFPPTSAILCRVTAPLIGLALDLLTRGVACNVLGRDIAVGLVTLTERMQATGVNDLKQRLEDYKEKETKKLIRKGKAKQADALSDRVTALLLLTYRCLFVADVKRKIEDLFRAGPGVTLSTVHKAKGLEWETVFILDFDEYMPSPWASKEELEQEHNLIYVAQTRAKLHLKYIESNKWKK
jgi:hypothetical protein